MAKKNLDAFQAHELGEDGLREVSGGADTKWENLQRMQNVLVSTKNPALPRSQVGNTPAPAPSRIVLSGKGGGAKGADAVDRPSLLGPQKNPVNLSRG